MEKIGFVGTGAMGTALLSRLKLANVPAIAFDIAPAAMEAARKEGAETAASAKAVAQASTIIDVVVRTDQDILDCTIAKDGILEGAAPGTLVLLHSTIRPTTWKKVAEAAADKRVYVSYGVAEVDADGKKWNTQIVIDPKGQIVGRHHKIWLTKETGFTEKGDDHNVFEVKGVKIGISTCADGTDRKNLEALVANGAKIIYGPHANTTGGTTAGWYKFRAAWGGPGGWIAQLKVQAALNNHAGLYNPEFQPPPGNDANGGWASGAWFIGPDGKTLGQMPASTQKGDSKEYVLIQSIPLR